MSGATASSRGPAIAVKDLSKAFTLHTERRDSIKERFVRGSGRSNQFWALRDVSFEIPHGSTFGLIGSNGSGKSTLLKMLAGIYRPTSGSVAVNGRVSALLELGAGFHGELTGRENVYLNGAILGMSRKQIDAAMDQIIDFAGIDDFIDVPVKVYSSGMYVRLGFSIAVTVDPEILIVDEIIAVGDEEFQRKCFEHLYDLRRRGTTIVLVSHSLGLVADLCDGAVWLEKGDLRIAGKARDVIDEYLGEVNAKEAAADEGVAAPETSGRTARLGSGEVRLDRVEFIGADGSVGNTLITGEPCTVRMHYRADRDLPNVTFGLAFVHESGVTVSGPNSGGAIAGYALSAGTGFIDFSSDPMPLMPGSYAVTSAVVDHGHVFDYVDRGYDLRVRARAAITESGLMQWRGSWTGPVETAAQRRTESAR